MVLTSTFLLNNALIVIRSSTFIFIIDSTLINQHRKLTNLLIHDEFLDLRMQATLKNDTLGILSSHPTVMQVEHRQLLKLYNIVNNNHVSLFQLKELDLLLAMNINRKLLLKELGLEILPSDISTYNFNPLVSIVPLILRFLSKHMSTKHDLLRVRTSHHSEDLLNLLQPNLSTIWVAHPLKIQRNVPLELS